jgi:hypothetical protein
MAIEAASPAGRLQKVFLAHGGQRACSESRNCGSGGCKFA